MEHHVYPCLWFDGQAKTAAEFYCSVFSNAVITSESPMAVTFELNGTKFMALNGGPKYRFSPATSFVIECNTQEEIDYYWDKLGEGGKYDHCGWLYDKFGMSWQVVPAILGKLMSDPVSAPRVVEAFMSMTKFNIRELENASIIA